MITDRNFSNMFARTTGAFQRASPVHTERWQGDDISKRPDMVSYELLNWNCNVSLAPLDHCRPTGNDLVWSNKLALYELGRILEPNLPWADDHFLERVGGEPLNPGVQWANWPWASSADKHRRNGEQFNHTYMERLWPKYAGRTPFNDGKLTSLLGTLPEGGCNISDHDGFCYQHRQKEPCDGVLKPSKGIRHEYGDLQDLVELIANEPLTRQAWIPLFFPEDTGLGDGGRKPCTLGYQFIMRDGQLSIYYPLRSCDYVRHFRDDIYLAIRLLLWVLDRCREINPKAWNDVTPGYYAMHCTSLHIFKNDYIQMFGVK